jgi:hypothetical protein
MKPERAVEMTGAWKTKISIDAEHYTILVSDALKKTVYGRLQGTRLKKLPENPTLRPNKEVLTKHRLIAGL